MQEDKTVELDTAQKHLTDLHQIIETQSIESIREICDAPELKVVKRLSCFEEICPSELDRTEYEDQNDKDLMLPMTPISQLILMEAAENDEALE